MSRGDGKMKDSLVFIILFWILFVMFFISKDEYRKIIDYLITADIILLTISIIWNYFEIKKERDNK